MIGLSIWIMELIHAFNTVLHKYLIHTLEQHAIKGQLLLWTQSFLAG